MRKTLAEFTFGTWTAPALAVTVEFPLEIMDELRLAATSGMRQLARGGLEIGGVLFGSRRDNLVRVVNWRSIPCEHARGPALLLSDKDREGLKALLAKAADEPDLHGLQAIGWFVSHTRSEVSLLDSDREIFREFFPESWQVTLVLRPERGGDCRAGFFVRENGELLRTESSYHEFTVEALSGPAPAPLQPRAQPWRRAVRRLSGLPVRPTRPWPRARTCSGSRRNFPLLARRVPDRAGSGRFRESWLWCWWPLLCGTAFIRFHRNRLVYVCSNMATK